MSAAAPHQAMSDAKQALAGAQGHLKPPLSAEDKRDYMLARGLIKDGETALTQRQYAKANALFTTSQQHARAILKRHQQRHGH